METSADIIIIGAGIAGISLAAQLSPHKRVIVLERESQPGYHATGRSAAVYLPTHGPKIILNLIRASGDFFHKPSQELFPQPLLSPRSVMVIAKPEDTDHVEQARKDGMVDISLKEAQEKLPALDARVYPQALIDNEAFDIDVDLLLQGLKKKIKQNGGKIITNAEVTSISQTKKIWQIQTTGDAFTAPIIVNASGAWADEVADMAGLGKLSIQPKRRSAALIDVSSRWDVTNWPFVVGAGDTFYFRPMGGKLMVSPADQTNCEPHDAWADDMAVAQGLALFQQATGFEITHVEHTWAGLRTFAPDGNPVVGYDPRTAGFFWLAGQGGYGIETSPAIARIAHALIDKTDIPADIQKFGADKAHLDPVRFL